MIGAVDRLDKFKGCERMALVSNGPSAKDYYRLRRTGALNWTLNCIAGVNWVVEKTRCDIWCFFDWTTWLGDLECDGTSGPAKPLGDPIYWCGPGINRLKQNPEFWGHRPIIGYKALQGHPFPNWHCWSGCLAFGAVLYLMPKQCSIWGMDLTGASDAHDGKRCLRAVSSRSEDRWGREADTVQKWVDILTEKGVALDWHCEPRGVKI